jgi:hypothetical protein
VPGLPQYKLTIGELFPANDLVAQWVFTVTSVAEDILMLMARLETDQLREKMLFYRLLTTRLYEARRLVFARAEHTAIREFAGDMNFAGVDLVKAYTPGEDGKSSVEKLYDAGRHRTVHYSSIGSDELCDLLHAYRNFPARMVTSEGGGKLTIEYQWVTAIRAQDSWGTPPWSPDIVKHLESFGQQTSTLAMAWTMLSTVYTALYARRRDIPFERIVDDADDLRALVELHRAHAQPEVGPRGAEPDPGGGTSD